MIKSIHAHAWLHTDKLTDKLEITIDFFKSEHRVTLFGKLVKQLNKL